jgi:phosphoglycerate dehydrogenase-like enzyme
MQQPGTTETRPVVVLLIPHRQFREILDEEAENALRAVATVKDLGGNGEVTPDALAEALADADAVITSWGSPFLSRELIERAPRLRFIGHAAGTIKPYVDVYALEKGLTVVNAARVMGRGVAEMTLLFALASLRSLIPFQCTNKPAHRWDRNLPIRGLFFQRVGLVGLGQVGRYVLQLFAPFQCRFQVYDPYLPESEAARLGIEKCNDLGELFATSRIVSLHAAVTDETVGMIRREHFERMQPGAVFINTARGKLVDYAALVEAAVNGRIQICLDVTDPHEPLPSDSPLWDLPNVMITPHIAGPTPDRRVDMGQDVVARLLRFWRSEPIEGVITLEQYHRMA